MQQQGRCGGTRMKSLPSPGTPLTRKLSPPTVKWLSSMFIIIIILDAMEMQLFLFIYGDFESFCYWIWFHPQSVSAVRGVEWNRAWFCFEWEWEELQKISSLFPNLISVRWFNICITTISKGSGIWVEVEVLQDENLLFKQNIEVSEGLFATLLGLWWFQRDQRASG